MELKNLFKNSSNDTLDSNKELLEEHGLINILGSPNKLFLKFLKSKDMEISEDEITPELIEEFENSIDSINLKLAKIEREKEVILHRKKVWINLPLDDEVIGTDLVINPDGVTIEEIDEDISYSDMTDIEISEGGWSKEKMIIYTPYEDFVFEVNENKAVPLKEILEEKIKRQNRDEFDDLLELHSLYEEGKISEEELEARKAIIYSDDEYCTNCGAKLDLDADFCPECGHKIPDN